MSPGPPQFNINDIFPTSEPGSIEAGFIGWDGEDDHAELGTTDDDGNTLVKVTLLSGSYPESGEENQSGDRVLCQLGGYPFWVVPKPGMRCYVAFPNGGRGVPGAGVIVACPATNPSNQFSKTKAKMDLGDDRDLVIKARSITLVTHNPDGGGKEDFFSLSPEGGIQAIDRDGNGFLIKDGEVVLYASLEADVKTMVRLTSEKFEIGQKTSGGQQTIFKIEGNKVLVLAKIFQAMVAQTMLGFGATPATPALCGQSGPSGMPSTSVFVSLV